MVETGSEIRSDLKTLKLVTSEFQPLDGPRPEVAVPPVIWAVDAFPDDLDLQIKTAKALQAVFPRASIHPVYVLSEETFFDHNYSAYLRPALKPMAFKAALRIISESGLRNIKKPRILNGAGNSRAAAAGRLLRYAKKIGASTIAVGSHARRGLNRLFATNFADELIEAAEIPVLIAGPRSVRSSDKSSVEHFDCPRTIIFPTDFSPACEAAFESILAMAVQHQAELHILHRETYAVDPYAQIGMSTMGSGWVSVDTLPVTENADQIDRDHQAHVERWRKRADERNVTIRFISQSFGEPLAEAIVDYVQRADSRALLTMVSQTGPVAATLLGSVTREVIRLSPCPIYVAPRFVRSK